jgi:hypothetical protein
VSSAEIHVARSILTMHSYKTMESSMAADNPLARTTWARTQRKPKTTSDLTRR